MPAADGDTSAAIALTEEPPKEHTKEEAQEVKDTAEEVKADTKEEDIKVTKEGGLPTGREDGSKGLKVTKDIKEVAKEAMEAVRDTKEEVKEGTKGGTRQEVTAALKAEVKRARHLSPSRSATATNVVVKGIWLKTALTLLTRFTPAQGGQQG